MPGDLQGIWGKRRSAPARKIPILKQEVFSMEERNPPDHDGPPLAEGTCSARWAFHAALSCPH